MTPIKRFVYVGLVIYVEDYANCADLVCVAANEAQRDFILLSLKNSHGVPAEAAADLEEIRTRVTYY